ncbi:MAG: DUF1566 domain-containing protein [Desulfamplus sp.]|nr:DUF1566 domain-containing protein [Desulfamplus sp.]
MAHSNNLFKSLIVSFIITCFAQPAFSSFTKLDSFGNALLDNAREWVMVKDTDTGLIWEVKSSSDDQPNYNDPHDPDNTYTWYDSNPATNGGDAGINGELTDTEYFITTLNNNRFGGFTDWRMPTKNELLSIVDYSVANPTVNTAYFKNTISDYYWTATTVSDYPEQAWKVNFYDGAEGYHEKLGEYRARSVRSSITQPAGGSLTVSLSPQDAINAGAMWRVDGGNWQNSGVTISNLSTGNHTLEFYDIYDIAGWIAPLSQNVVIVDGQTKTVAGVYTQRVYSGSLTVNLSPQDAINAGAMWRVDGGNWQNSGTTLSNLDIGNHSLEFYDIYDIAGWIAPLSQNVVIVDGQTTTVAGVYTQQVSGGSLIVTISPQDALNAGAMWRVDGGDWQNSGVKISNLSIGNHTLEFKDIAGWTNPSSQIVTIRDGENTIVPVRYVKSAPTNLTDIKDISNIIDQIDEQSDITNITDKLTDNVNTIQENIPEDTTTQPSNELVDAINTTTLNIGNIIDKSLDLFKKDEISLEQVLKPLELLDGIIDLGGKTAKSGGAISIEKVAGSMESVENLIELAISKGATSEQAKKSSENINNILGNIPDVMNAVKITGDVIKILGPIKGVTGAGIKSALKGNSNPSSTVGTMGEIVVQGLREASDAIIVINTGGIIKSAGDIVNHAVNVLQTDTTDKTVINNTLDVLQIQLGKMIEQTASNIKDKPVKAKSLNSFAGVTSKSSGIFSGLDDFVYVMDNVSGLTASMIRAKSVLKSDLTGKMQTLSLETIKNILPAFVSRDAANRFAAVRNDSDIQELLNDSSPQLINDLIKIASVNLTSGMLISKEDIEQAVKNNSSLTTKEKDRLIKGLPELPVFDQNIVKFGKDTLSLVDLLQKELDTIFQGSLLQGTKVEVVSTKSLQLMIILKNQSIGFNMPLYIQDARVVSSIIPEGLHILPEGLIILVRNGIAGIITPAPLDAVDTLLSADALLKIKRLFGSAKKEIYDVKISNSGNLNLKFKDGSRFSGDFAYGTAKDGDGNFDAGTSSFELHGTDPATEAYSVLVVYEDGSTQQLTSSVSALEQLVDVLDTFAAGSYTLDRATGIFTVLGARFKPSYLIEPITTSDIAWFNTNKDNIYSIAWEVDDYNNDGVVDLKMWTADGKQVIYTVIQ